MRQTLRAKENVRKQSENHECAEILINRAANTRKYYIFKFYCNRGTFHACTRSERKRQGFTRLIVMENDGIYCNVAKGICRKEPAMVKIKISYETPDELEEVLRLLHPVTSSCKVPKCQNGAYKRAYVEAAINRQQNGGEVEKC